MTDQSTAAAEPMPRRIQRSRAKGWRMPPNTIYVGRPSRWGNPFQGADATLLFRRFVAGQMTVAEMAAHGDWPFHIHRGPEMAAAARAELRGKNLACWCRLDQPCHADVLLELANAPLICEAAP